MTPYNSTNITKNLNHIFKYITIGYIILSVLEIILFPAWKVFYALLCSMFGIKLCQYTLIKESKLYWYPVSTIALLLYTVFFEISPLPATLLELKPLTFNMHSSFDTFTHLILLQASLTATHSLYIYTTNRKNILRNFLRKTSFYDAYSYQELWFIILASTCWYSYKMINYGLFTEDNMNVNSTFNIFQWTADLLTSTFYSTLFLFYFKKFNCIKGEYQANTPAIILITIILFLVGIGSNMRTQAIMPIASGAFMLFIYKIYHPEEYKIKFKFRYLCIIGFVLWFFASPFQDISNAMLAVRSQRAGQNATEVLALTVSTNDRYYDQEENHYDIEENFNKKTTLLWDEYYFNNDLLKRFCSLKVLDETLFHANRLNASDRSIMRDELVKNCLDRLPKVIKKTLGINTERKNISLSDKMYYLSTRDYSESMRIGTLQGLGLGLFNYWYILIIIPFFYIIFYMMDSFVRPMKGEMHYSILFFVQIFMLAYYFSDRHYYLNEYLFIVRGYWEMVVFFLITTFIVKRIPFIKH